MVEPEKFPAPAEIGEKLKKKKEALAVQLGREVSPIDVYSSVLLDMGIEDLGLRSKAIAKHFGIILPPELV